MIKKKIALVTGGYSGEAQISYKSAVTIANHLDASRYEVYKIDINPQGWFYEDGEGRRTEVDRKDFSLSLDGRKVSFDAIFIGMHGTPGEDGKLQGYFDMLGLPYTSCDAATSALTFNKRYTVAVAALAGIAVAKSVHLFRGGGHSPESVLQELRLPVFVKPNNGGSSIGMSKVSAADELAPALEKAFREDSQVLVEEAVTGREFTVGVYGAGGEVKVLPITEITTGNEFFDFQAKYEGASRETTPAEIPSGWQEAMESAARRIYSVFNCRGVVRIDFIVDPAGPTPYMLEINTVPGQSEASIIPQQVRAAGGHLREFYTGLVEEALTRGAGSPA